MSDEEAVGEENSQSEDEEVDLVLKGARTTDIQEEFTVQAVLGSGGFSTVYTAIDNSNGDVVAIKHIVKYREEPDRMMPWDLHKQYLINEVATLVRLSGCPNVVQLYDIYEDAGNIFMVFELIDGEELFDMICANGYYPEHEAVQILRAVCRGLKACHDRNVMHRDIKPENIMCPISDKNTHTLSKATLIDFGLAAILESGTYATEASGSPGYVAPEILVGCPYDRSVDMWSLGVTAYILLAGYPPWVEDTEVPVEDQIIAGDYEFHEPEWNEVSNNAKDWISRLLVLDPKKRMTVAEALQHPFLRTTQQASVEVSYTEVPVRQTPIATRLASSAQLTTKEKPDVQRKKSEMRPEGNGKAEQAESKIPAPVSKPEVKPETPKPEIKPETPKPEVKPETPKPEIKPETPKPEIKPEPPKPEIPKPEIPKPEIPKPEPPKPEKTIIPPPEPQQVPPKKETPPEPEPLKKEISPEPPILDLQIEQPIEIQVEIKPDEKHSKPLLHLDLENTKALGKSRASPRHIASPRTTITTVLKPKVPVVVSVVDVKDTATSTLIKPVVPSTESPPTAVTVAPKIATSTPSVTGKCSTCGSVPKPGAKFCGNCGARAPPPAIAAVSPSRPPATITRTAPPVIRRKPYQPPDHVFAIPVIREQAAKSVLRRYVPPDHTKNIPVLREVYDPVTKSGQTVQEIVKDSPSLSQKVKFPKRGQGRPLRSARHMEGGEILFSARGVASIAAAAVAAGGASVPELPKYVPPDHVANIPVKREVISSGPEKKLYVPPDHVGNIPVQREVAEKAGLPRYVPPDHVSNVPVIKEVADMTNT